MVILIIIVILDWICLFLINPVNIMTWVSLISNISFILRPFSIHVKLSKIIPVEVLLAFLAFNGSLILRTFSIKTYLLMILVRLVFYAVVWYDDTQFVYIQEEEEREI